MHKEELIKVLQATLSPDAELRRHAENALAAAASDRSEQGFCISLIDICLHGHDLDVGIRQLAAVVLRRTIEQRWDIEEEYDDENAPGMGSATTQISEEEKAQIRSLLPSGLGEPNSRIQTAVSMAIAEIGRHDYPSKWPELLPGLIQAINTTENPLLVSGAVNCLGMLAEDLSESQVISTAEMVLPQLLRLLGMHVGPENISVHRRSLHIFKTTLEAFELLYMQNESVKQNIAAILPPWMKALSDILQKSPSVEDHRDWALKFDALSCLCKIVRSFARLASEGMSAVMSSTWQLFVSLLPLYQSSIILGNEDSPTPLQDEPGLDTVTLPDLVSELFEFILTLVGSSRFGPHIRSSFEDLVYLTIGYIQASNIDVEQWSNDINSYLGEESEFWSPRASGELILEELAQSKNGILAVSNALDKRKAEAETLKMQGNPEWWRMREAVILGIGYISHPILERLQSHRDVPPWLQPESIASMILSEDLKSDLSPFIAGRAMWTIARFAPALSSSTKGSALKLIAPAIAPGNSPQIQAGACQAASQLCKNAPEEDIKLISSDALGGLCALLPKAEEDSLHLLLETITVFVRADPSVAAKYGEQLIPLALNIWIENINDPLIGEDADILIRALANNPHCLTFLQNQAIPTLCEIISSPVGNSAILVSGSLDLLITLLTPSSSSTALAIGQACSSPAASLISSSDDDEILASATALVRTLFQIVGLQALTWFETSSGSQDGLSNVLKVIHHLLNSSSISDRARRNVGGLILELLRKGSTEMRPHMAMLLSSLVNALSSAEDPATVQSFLQVLAFLVNQDAVEFVECLSSIPLQQHNDNSRTAFQVAMERWMERQMEVRTPYDIRLTTTALASLLLCAHPAIDSLIVKGKRIDNDIGIRTRSRAAQHAEQWNQVPLRVKIVMVLADAYIESKTQKSLPAGDFDDNDEEEWIKDDEDDDDEDDDASLPNLDANGLFSSYFDIPPLYSDDEDDLELLALANLDPLEAKRRETDPLSLLDVGDYVSSVFKTMSETAPAVLQEASQQLTPTQIQAVQKIWHS